jgi:hypothetical protein
MYNKHLFATFVIVSVVAVHHLLSKNEPASFDLSHSTTTHETQHISARNATSTFTAHPKLIFEDGNLNDLDVVHFEQLLNGSPLNADKQVKLQEKLLDHPLKDLFNVGFSLWNIRSKNKSDLDQESLITDALIELNELISCKTLYSKDDPRTKDLDMFLYLNTKQFAKRYVTSKFNSELMNQLITAENGVGKVSEIYFDQLFASNLTLSLNWVINSSISDKEKRNLLYSKLSFIEKWDPIAGKYWLNYFSQIR